MALCVAMVAMTVIMAVVGVVVRLGAHRSIPIR